MKRANRKDKRIRRYVKDIYQVVIPATNDLSIDFYEKALQERDLFLNELVLSSICTGIDGILSKTETGFNPAFYHRCANTRNLGIPDESINKDNVKAELPPIKREILDYFNAVVIPEVIAKWNAKHDKQLISENLKDSHFLADQTKKYRGEFSQLGQEDCAKGYHDRQETFEDAESLTIKVHETFKGGKKHLYKEPNPPKWRKSLIQSRTTSKNNKSNSAISLPETSSFNTHTQKIYFFSSAVSGTHYEESDNHKFNVSIAQSHTKSGKLNVMHNYKYNEFNKAMALENFIADTIDNSSSDVEIFDDPVIIDNDDDDPVIIDNDDDDPVIIDNDDDDPVIIDDCDSNTWSNDSFYINDLSPDEDDDLFNDDPAVTEFIRNVDDSMFFNIGKLHDVEMISNVNDRSDPFQNMLVDVRDDITNIAEDSNGGDVEIYSHGNHTKHVFDMDNHAFTKSDTTFSANDALSYCPYDISMDCADNEGTEGVEASMPNINNTMMVGNTKDENEILVAQIAEAEVMNIEIDNVQANDEVAVCEHKDDVAVEMDCEDNVSTIKDTDYFVGEDTDFVEDSFSNYYKSGNGEEIFERISLVKKVHIENCCKTIVTPNINVFSFNMGSVDDDYKIAIIQSNTSNETCLPRNGDEILKGPAEIEIHSTVDRTAIPTDINAKMLVGNSVRDGNSADIGKITNGMSLSQILCGQIAAEEDHDVDNNEEMSFKIIECISMAHADGSELDSSNNVSSECSVANVSIDSRILQISSILNCNAACIPSLDITNMCVFKPLNIISDNPCGVTFKNHHDSLRASSPSTVISSVSKISNTILEPVLLQLMYTFVLYTPLLKRNSGILQLHNAEAALRNISHKSINCISSIAVWELAFPNRPAITEVKELNMVQTGFSNDLFLSEHDAHPVCHQKDLMDVVYDDLNNTLQEQDNATKGNSKEKCLIGQAGVRAPDISRYEYVLSIGKELPSYNTPSLVDVGSLSYQTAENAFENDSQSHLTSNSKSYVTGHHGTVDPNSLIIGGMDGVDICEEGRGHFRDNVLQDEILKDSKTITQNENVSNYPRISYIRDFKLEETRDDKACSFLKNYDNVARSPILGGIEGDDLLPMAKFSRRVEKTPHASDIHSEPVKSIVFGNVRVDEIAENDSSFSTQVCHVVSKTPIPKVSKPLEAFMPQSNEDDKMAPDAIRVDSKEPPHDLSFEAASFDVFFSQDDDSDMEVTCPEVVTKLEDVAKPDFLEKMCTMTFDYIGRSSVQSVDSSVSGPKTNKINAVEINQTHPVNEKTTSFRKRKTIDLNDPFSFLAKKSEITLLHNKPFSTTGILHQETGIFSCNSPIAETVTNHMIENADVLEKKKFTLDEVVHVTLSDDLLEVAHLMETFSLPIVKKLLSVNKFKFSMNLTLDSVTSELIHFLLNQELKFCEDNGVDPRHGGVDESCYCQLLVFHGVVKALEILIHTDLSEAVRYFEAYQLSHRSILKNCYQQLLDKMCQTHTKLCYGNVVHPKIECVSSLLVKAYDQSKSYHIEYKVLIIVKRDLQIVFQLLKSKVSEVLRNVDIVQIHESVHLESRPQEMSNKTNCVFVASILSLSRNINWSQFTLVVEYESREDCFFWKNICQEFQIAFSSIQVQNLNFKTFEDIVALTSFQTELCEHLEEVSEFEIIVIASETVTLDSDLLKLLETKGNISVVGRDYRKLLPDLCFPDIAVNASTAIILVTLRQLESREFIDNLLERIFFFHMKYDTCWVIFYDKGEKPHNSTSRRQIESNLWQVYTLSQVITLRFEQYIVKFLFAENYDQILGYIKDVIEKSCCDPKKKMEATLQTLFSYDMSQAEVFLMSFSCLNSFRVQMMLSSSSVPKLLTMTLSELMSQFPTFPIPIVELFHSIIHTEVFKSPSSVVQNSPLLSSPSSFEADAKNESIPFIDHSLSTCLDDIASSPDEASLNDSCSDMTISLEEIDRNYNSLKFEQETENHEVLPYGSPKHGMPSCKLSHRFNDGAEEPACEWHTSTYHNIGEPSFKLDVDSTAHEKESYFNPHFNTDYEMKDSYSNLYCDVGKKSPYKMHNSTTRKLSYNFHSNPTRKSPYEKHSGEKDASYKRYSSGKELHCKSYTNSEHQVKKSPYKAYRSSKCCARMSPYKSHSSNFHGGEVSLHGSSKYQQQKAFDPDMHRSSKYQQQKAFDPDMHRSTKYQQQKAFDPDMHRSSKYQQQKAFDPDVQDTAKFLQLQSGPENMVPFSTDREHPKGPIYGKAFLDDPLVPNTNNKASCDKPFTHQEQSPPKQAFGNKIVSPYITNRSSYAQPKFQPYISVNRPKCQLNDGESSRFPREGHATIVSRKSNSTLQNFIDYSLADNRQHPSTNPFLFENFKSCLIAPKSGEIERKTRYQPVCSKAPPKHLGSSIHEVSIQSKAQKAGHKAVSSYFAKHTDDGLKLRGARPCTTFSNRIGVVSPMMQATYETDSPPMDLDHIPVSSSHSKLSNKRDFSSNGHLNPLHIHRPAKKQRKLVYERTPGKGQTKLIFQ